MRTLSRLRTESFPSVWWHLYHTEIPRQHSLVHESTSAQRQWVSCNKASSFSSQTWAICFIRELLEHRNFKDMKGNIIQKKEKKKRIYNSKIYKIRKDSEPFMQNLHSSRVIINLKSRSWDRSQGPSVWCPWISTRCFFSQSSDIEEQQINK